jgi:hypothetical protein
MLAFGWGGWALLERQPVAHSQGQLQEDPAIGYRAAGRNDAIARLQQRLNSGAVRLEYSETQGYLPSLLKLLDVPVSSQGLVFSKTSFQLHRISPVNPRALYFNDEVYVGWVRGGEVLELAAVDPQFGGVFYFLEQTKTAQPRFIRNDECLQCHATHNTKGVPGFVVRSVFPDFRGYPLAPLGSRVISHSSPLAERWGGWYVTGTHGKERHLGNLLFDERMNPDRIEATEGLNLSKPPARANLSEHLSTHSDIVALMVLEHQTQMHNLIARLNYETRIALSQQTAINEALGKPKDELTDSTRRRIERAATEVLRYLLFVDEARLNAPISGSTSFAKDFAARGVRDPQGRSLRDLDLRQRLFRYPCSYLIYSEAFDALPPQALEAVYRGLWQALTGQTRDQALASLSAADRQAVLEILRTTKRNLPSYFRP